MRSIDFEVDLLSNHEGATPDRHVQGKLRNDLHEMIQQPPVDGIGSLLLVEQSTAAFEKKNPIAHSVCAFPRTVTQLRQATSDPPPPVIQVGERDGETVARGVPGVPVHGGGALPESAGLGGGQQHRV